MDTSASNGVTLISLQRLWFAVGCLCIATTLVSFTGCGGGEENVDAYEDYLSKLESLMTQISDQLDTIQDQKSAAVAVDRVIGLCNAITAHLAAYVELPKLSGLNGLKVKESFESEWEEKFKRAANRLKKSADEVEPRVGRIPDLRRLESRLANTRNELEGFEEGYREALGL